MIVRVLVLAAFLLLPGLAYGYGDCTYETDCYCDCVTGADQGDGFVNAQCVAKNIPIDTNNLVCFDWEPPTMHDDVLYQGGGGPGSLVPPAYGPPYDETGRTDVDFRGRGSWWKVVMGGVQGGQTTQSGEVDHCIWTEGEPANPTRGISCSNHVGTGVCDSPREWRADDLWQGNDGACLDVIGDGEWDDDVTDLTDPVVPNLGTGVFDGHHSVGYRVPVAKTAGVFGNRRFSSAMFEIGVTMAVAYPVNLVDSQILFEPWKHAGLRSAGPGERKDGPIIDHIDTSLLPFFPFHAYMFTDTGPWDNNDCQAAVSEAFTNGWVRRGSGLECNGAGIEIPADPLYYNQVTDFPFGTWGCVRVHINGLGTSKMTYQTWFNETLIIDFDLNPESFESNFGYIQYEFQHYANRNQEIPTGSGNFCQVRGACTKETTFRYTDNIHITNGPPVSCEQIGFAASTCEVDGDCDDDDVCTTDTCDSPPGGTCVFTPNTDACDDGFSCTTPDTCDGAGSCVGTPVDANCDDSLYCTGVETCDVATGAPVTGCVDGADIDCDDSVACTDDSCNEGTDSCDNVTNDGNCDDAVFCNGAETCHVTLDCQAGSDPCPGQMCHEDDDTCHAVTNDPDMMHKLMSSPGGSDSRGPIKDGYVGYVSFSEDQSTSTFNVDAAVADVCMLPDTASTSGTATAVIRRVISGATEEGSMAYMTLTNYECKPATHGEYYMVIDHTAGSGLISVTGRK